MKNEVSSTQDTTNSEEPEKEKGLLSVIWEKITNFFKWLFGFDKTDEENLTEKINNIEKDAIQQIQELQKNMPSFKEMENSIAKMQHPNTSEELKQKINEDFWEGDQNITPKLNTNNLEKTNIQKKENTLYEEALKKALKVEREEPLGYKNTSLGRQVQQEYYKH